MKIASTLLTLGLSLSLFSQTPCVDGFAGIYPCERVDLQTHMDLTDLGGSPGLNDIWGWVDPVTGHEIALIGMLDRTAFVDITDPLNPIYIGKLDTHSGPSTWRDIKVYQDHAFIVSEAGSHGMQVFDLNQLRDVIVTPINFDESAHFPGFSNCHNVAINEESGYAYPIGTNEASGGPLFIDISDPLNPTLAGSYSDLGYSHDGQTVNYNGPDTDYIGREIYFGFHGNSSEGLVIVDVTDKTDPEAIEVAGYDCQDYTHQGWTTPDMRYCFVNDELDEGSFGFNTRTRIFNIEDLDNPILIGNYIADVASTDHNLYTDDTYAYMSNYTSGLRIVDHSQLDNSIMEEVAYFDVHPASDVAGYDGTWSNYPYFPSGNIVVTHRQDGLFIVKPHDLSQVVPTQLINEEICPAEVSVKEYGQLAFSLAPNPAQSQVQITASSELISLVEVTDLSGRLVLSQQFAPSEVITLELSSLNTGLYTITINAAQASAKKLSLK